MQPTGDVVGFAGDPGGVVGGEVDGGGGDVVGAADAAERGDGGDCLLALRDGGVGEAFGLDETGVDGVDADAAGAEFLGEGAGEAVHC